MGNPLPRVTVFFEKDEIEQIALLARKEFLTPQAYIRRKVMPLVQREAKRLEAAE